MSAPDVRDLMVPLDEYGSISEDAILYEALDVLEEALVTYDKSPFRHRAVVVVDDEGRPVGKVTPWVILRALEPRYEDIHLPKTFTRYGYTEDFIHTLSEGPGLLQLPMDHLCERVATIKVKDVMKAPSEGEFITEHATMETALHQLVMGHHQSLLVRAGEKVVGVLRLVDVFSYVAGLLRRCHNE